MISIELLAQEEANLYIALLTYLVITTWYRSLALHPEKNVEREDTIKKRARSLELDFTRTDGPWTYDLIQDINI